MSSEPTPTGSSAASPPGDGVDLPVDLLLIGHVTRDLIGETPESGWRLGGTVSFAALTALRMRREPLILTRAAAARDLDELPDSVRRIVLPSPSTTTFANIYTEHGRIQYCYTPAPAIRAGDVPAWCRKPRAVLLGPLVDEIGPDVPRLFGDDTLVAAVPQGWLRRWDETGRVFPKRWENAADILPHLDVLVLSLEDIDYDLQRIAPVFDLISLVVMTEYRDGSTIYQKQPGGGILQTKIAPRPASEVDPTGAGDIFTTAFLLRLQETGNPVEAARFANVTASYGVEHLGIFGVPTRETVLAYMEKYPFEPVVSPARFS
jgi:sugar/nucleoside kinase (ribokinase family)